jgi:Chaperone of endosialidase
MTKVLRSLLMLALAMVTVALPALGGQVAKVQITPSQVQWDPQVSSAGLVLTISKPDGEVVRQELAAGQTPVFELPAGAADGAYVYELRVVPAIDAAARRALAASRDSGSDATVERLRKAGRLPAGELVQSGTFRVVAGALVAPDAREESPAPVTKAAGKPGLPVKDQVIADDLIVQGSACVGLDCVANESFGFDTLRLKENNTRIKFDDTSTGTGFPANDWQLTANDSASGGANKFSIDDVTGSKTPFTITAGAPTSSIFVDSTGRLGLRTSTPVLDIHVATGNTPAMRLEQNASGGFTAQTWDIAGNEANFFVRDVTGGSRLPFRIRPGAPTSSIDINASGNVGIGTASASTRLHVSGSDGATKELIQESSGTTAPRELLELRNNGGTILVIDDTSDPTRWTFGTSGSSFVVDEQAHSGVEMSLTNTGNMIISGTLTQNSDRTTETDIVGVEPEEVLAKVASLPISTWHYKGDEASVQHLGPMAQDFAAAFGLGPDDRHIAPLDAAGVSLAAIQALNRKVSEKDTAIQELRKRNADLEKRLADLEALVNRLAPQPH